MLSVNIFPVKFLNGMHPSILYYALSKINLIISTVHVLYCNIEGLRENKTGQGSTVQWETFTKGNFDESSLQQL